MVVKRYSQMLLRSTKTDKADAEMILVYAMDNSQHLKLWEPLPEYIESCKDISGIVNLLLKQRPSLKNKRHSLKVKGTTKSNYFGAFKQVFALAKSGEYFDLEYVSVNPGLNVK